MHRSAHLIFIKYPEAGKVKTRLGRTIGLDRAADIYKSLVERLLSSSDRSSYDILFFIEPYEKLAEFRKWLGEGVYLPQTGADLGERMYNGFAAAFDAGYEKCVLTGSDIPKLDSHIIISGLADMQDAVIGRAEDGGYYLIGFRKDTLTDEVFKGIEWSTDAVFRQTMQIFESMGYRVAETETLADLDTAEDMRLLDEI